MCRLKKEKKKAVCSDDFDINAKGKPDQTVHIESECRPLEAASTGLTACGRAHSSEVKDILSFSELWAPDRRWSGSSCLKPPLTVLEVSHLCHSQNVPHLRALLSPGHKALCCWTIFPLCTALSKGSDRCRPCSANKTHRLCPFPHGIVVR